MARHSVSVVLAALVIFVACAPTAAAPIIQILSQRYTASGGIAFGGPFEYKSETSPVSVILEGGTLKAIADGATGETNGFLSALAYLVGAPGGAFAEATMDFRPSEWSSLNLTTSGFWVGFGLSYIQFDNLTDHTTLLLFYGTIDSGYSDLTGSFTFDLDPSKEYRLRAAADTPPDAASARVDYAVLPVPEPSGSWLLIAAVFALWHRRRQRLA